MFVVSTFTSPDPVQWASYRAQIPILSPFNNVRLTYGIGRLIIWPFVKPFPYLVRPAVATVCPCLNTPQLRGHSSPWQRVKRLLISAVVSSRSRQSTGPVLAWSTAVNYRPPHGTRSDRLIHRRCKSYCHCHCKRYCHRRRRHHYSGLGRPCSEWRAVSGTSVGCGSVVAAPFAASCRRQMSSPRDWDAGVNRVLSGRSALGKYTKSECGRLTSISLCIWVYKSEGTEINGKVIYF